MPFRNTKSRPSRAKPPRTGRARDEKPAKGTAQPGRSAAKSAARTDHAPPHERTADQNNQRSKAAGTGRPRHSNNPPNNAPRSNARPSDASGSNNNKAVPRAHAQAGKSRPRRNQSATGGPATTMRIAKAMARAGLCSRRDAERWILDRRVTVNGKRIDSPALDVGPKDRILIDDTPLPQAEPVRLWRYYKSKGQVTSHRDPQGRKTVFDALPTEMPRVMSIGRLDYNTEGLLLLTNDGALSRHLELPATGWMRRYRVRAHGRVKQETLDALKDGIEVDGLRYGPIEANLDHVQGANVWLSIGIREGKNREVRRVLATMDLEVNRLIRTSFGPFQLNDMKAGDAQLIRRRVLIDQLGQRLSSELGITDDGSDETISPGPANSQMTKPRPAPQSSRSRSSPLNKPTPSLKKPAATTTKHNASGSQTKPRIRNEKRKKLELIDKPYAGKPKTKRAPSKNVKARTAKTTGGARTSPASARTRTPARRPPERSTSSHKPAK